MPYKGERLAFLLASYSNRKITEAEEAELFALIKDDAVTEIAIHEHIEKLMAEFNSRDLMPAVNWDHLYLRIQEKNNPDDAPLAAKWWQLHWLHAVAAASIVLLVGISALYLFRSTADKNIATLPAAIAPANDAAPGTTGAILTLANGRQIVLDSAGNRLALLQGNSQLLNHGGRLTYNNSTPAGRESVVYNTMTTTKGRQYQLQLSDGSKIWLNAASSITFPTTFNEPARKISITGEAYFEIAHDAKHPFIVSTGNMEVQVLGTHFNINAYADEDNTSTTLLEGSVKIKTGETTTLMLPGQQLQQNKEGKLKLVTDADAQEAVAWKDGLFMMKKAGIASIMRQLERWYDVDVTYPAGIPVGRISGDIPRNMNLSKVLEVMELSGVHVTISGRKIIVAP
jgi:transmembrane sensor